MISEVDLKDYKEAGYGQPSITFDTDALWGTHDPVNKPKHYTEHPSGVECIQITEHMNFLLGNAMKYIWRADLKNGVEDLQKAVWYVNREIAKRAEALSPTIEKRTK